MFFFLPHRDGMPLKRIHSKDNVIDRLFRYNERVLAFVAALIVAIIGYMFTNDCSPSVYLMGSGCTGVFAVVAFICLVNIGQLMSLDNELERDSDVEVKGGEAQ